MRLRWPWVTLPVAVGSILATGCRKTEPLAAPEPTPAPAPVASQPEPGPTAGGVVAIDAARQMLPASTMVWVEARSPRRLLAILERDAIAKRMPGEYAGVATVLEGTFGVDPLRADNLKELGIDADRPIGAFVLDVRGDALGAYVTLEDPSRFRELVMEHAEAANIEFSPTSLGGAEILRDKWGSTAVVIRGEYAAIVNGSKESDSDWSQILATVEPSDALPASGTFRSSVGEPGDADVAVFVSPAAIASALVEERRRVAQATGNFAAEALAEARRSGATPQRLAELENRAEEVTEQNRLWERRQLAEAMLVQTMFGGIEALAMAGDMTKDGPMFDVRALVAPDAFPKSVVRNVEGAPSLSSALSDPPLLLVTAGFDVDALVEFFDAVAQTEGDSWQSWVDEVERRSGVDLDADLRPLLTGVGGFAITLDDELDLEKPDAMRRAIGFSGHARVTDPATVRRLLQRASRQLKLDGHRLRRNRRVDGYSVDVPGWRTLYCTVAGDHLVVTTDPGLPARVATGKPGALAKRIEPPAAYAAVSVEDRALTFASDLGLLGWLGWGMPVPVLSALPTAKEGGRSDDPPEVRRLERELMSLRAEIAAAEGKARGARMRQMLAMIEPFGMTVFTVRETDKGLQGSGGQFLRASGVAELVEVVARNLRPPAGRASAEKERLHDLWERAMELEEKLRVAREAQEPSP